MNKQTMRQQMERLRAELTESERAQKSAYIAEQTIRFLRTIDWSVEGEGEASSVMFSYVPFRTEVDIRAVWSWCLQAGIGLAVPKVLANKKRMQLYLIRGELDLQPGAWGILEPRESCVPLSDNRCIRAVLVPGLAFDARMARLGYGGGYYDRFFAEFADPTHLPVRIATAFERQMVAFVPTEPHDIPMSVIVTESNTWVSETQSRVTRSDKSE
jgi:5-formyltetrahydrofolate cyclo-ligase